MSRSLRAVLALVVAFAPALARTARADEGVDAAREHLKDSEAELNASDRKGSASERAEDLKKATAAVTRIREAENEEALLFLLNYAKDAVNSEVFDKLKAELGLLTNDDAVTALASFLTKKDARLTPEGRILAAEVAGKIESPKITEALVTALGEEDPNFLTNAIGSAARKDDKRILTTLLDLLKKLEKGGGLEVVRTRQALTDITGQDFLTYDKWKTWWDANKETFVFAKRSESKEVTTQEKGAKFFDTTVRSNRFVFVIDISGSMKMPDPPEKTQDTANIKKLSEGEPNEAYLSKYARIERAKRELKGAIKSLDSRVRFDILSFSDKFNTWRPDITAATDKDKKDALAWVDQLKPEGGTFTDDALKRAFEMAEIDTIYFLSDGAPDKGGGTAAEKELMAKCYDLILLETRFRKVVIHSFGVCGIGVWYKAWGQRPPSLSLDPNEIKPLRDFMEKVAKMTGGQFKPI